jgi:hypothetical protein
MTTGRCARPSSYGGRCETTKSQVCCWLLDCLPPVLRHLAHVLSSFIEIEAAEACKWLRATGFPQYAQMYEGKVAILQPLGRFTLQKL